MRTWKEYVYVLYTRQPTSATKREYVYDYALTPTIDVTVTPLWLGVTISRSPESLFQFIADGEGLNELLDNNSEALFDVYAACHVAADIESIGVLTVWDASSGMSYIPGEPTEYETDIQLVGYVRPGTLEYVAL